MSIKKSKNVFSLKGLIVLLSSLMVGCVKVSEKEAEIYLLPENYKGSVYIIFNVLKGEEAKYEHGARVYEIPASGVLLTKMKSNEGWIDSNKVKYFYLTKDGKRKPIKSLWTSSLTDTLENRNDKEITIFGGGLGEFEPIQGCNVLMQDFIVGTKAEVLDNKLYFDIYSDKGIKSMDQSIFKTACR